MDDRRSGTRREQSDDRVKGPSVVPRSCLNHTRRRDLCRGTEHAVRSRQMRGNRILNPYPLVGWPFRPGRSLDIPRTPNQAAPLVSSPMGSPRDSATASMPPVPRWEAHGTCYAIPGDGAETAIDTGANPSPGRRA